MRPARRRVVTGHDVDGRSTVILDDVSDDVISNRASSSSTVVWAERTLPVDNSLVEPELVRSGSIGKFLEGGAVFRVVRYEPGGEPRMHRTTSLDFAVVLTGTIVLILDDCEAVLSAGDLIVQRGTMHGWRNPGPEACEIAFVLLDASPVEVEGHTLGNEGW